MITSGWKNKYNVTNMPKSREFLELMKVHSSVIDATYSFFAGKGLFHVNVPLTTSSASSPMGPGSDSAPVSAVISNGTVLLTDSAQFYLEYACRATESGCYYYGHSFRDEEPDKRHLSQFSHIEAEIPGDLPAVKALVEEFVIYLSDFLLNKNRDILSQQPNSVERITDLLNNKRFTTVSFDEALRLLENVPGAIKECVSGHYVVTAVGEHWLTDKFGIVWLENWDRLTVPFYQAKDSKSGRAINADMLFPTVGEVVGAGQRHTAYYNVLCALEEQGVSPEAYQWSVDMKKDYPLPTSGFGIGVERYLMWLLNVDDIRSVELFSRRRDQSGEI